MQKSEISSNKDTYYNKKAVNLQFRGCTCLKCTNQVEYKLVYILLCWCS